MSSRLALPTLSCLLLAAVAGTLWALRSQPVAAALAPTEWVPREAPAAAEVQPPGHTPPRAEVLASAQPASISAVPALEREWLEVRVVVRDGFEQGEQNPVPDVPVAVGLGSPLSQSAPPSVTAASDAEGLCDLRLPWSAVKAARAEGGRIWARVLGPGWIEHSATADLPESPIPGAPLELSLYALPGFTARGVLIGTDGNPTHGTIKAPASPSPGSLPGEAGAPPPTVSSSCTSPRRGGSPSSAKLPSCQWGGAGSCPWPTSTRESCAMW